MESSLAIPSAPGAAAGASFPEPPAASFAAGAVAAPPQPVRPVELVRALGGWAGLALVGLAATPSALGGGVALTLAPPVGALLLTVPALLVGHQYLGLKAAPAALVGTLIRAFCRSGDVALGLAPLALLFAATSRLGPAVVVAALLAASLQGLLVAMKRLQQLEIEVDPADWGARGRMGVLVVAWAGLYGLIGLRLSWNLLAHLFA